jgi:hypothetical protein
VRAALTVVLVVAVVAGCRTPEVGATHGGAGFRDVKVEASTVPLQALFGVCWPADALKAQRVVLTWLADDVMFEAREGASNSTGRCLREIATTYVSTPRPTGTLEVGPPAQPLDGWAVLAWVKLLAPSRFGPERGFVDPGPLVRACVAQGLGLRASTAFTVRHVPGPEVRVLPSAMGEAERCVEAVLGSTAWPSPRELFFELRGTTGAPPPEGDVSPWFGPPGSSGAAMDPSVVKESVRLVQPKVAACWEGALERRASLGGARTLRFRVDEQGVVTAAWVASTMAEGAAAADAMLDRCLVDALKQAHFPPSAADGFYTWVFAARG